VLYLENTTGKYNIALGKSAMRGDKTTPITGNNNVALGNNTLSSNTSGN
jgi:hypothetical protein